MDMNFLLQSFLAQLHSKRMASLFEIAQIANQSNAGRSSLNVAEKTTAICLDSGFDHWEWHVCKSSINCTQW
jgi:hypothetical protein